MNDPIQYVLGHTELEIERLKLQASIIGGVTERLIKDCGIGSGMTVLDLGCGAGDVSFLLSKALGPSGKVLGIDRESKAVETARRRLAGSGIQNIEFIVASDDTIPGGASFDAVFGRYVLVHQADPVAMLRQAAAAVRPGGILAFHELVLRPPNNAQAYPRVELFDLLADAVRDTMRATLLSPDMASSMLKCFRDAGLVRPHVFWETIVGGADSPLAQWFVHSYRVLHPHAQKLGLAPAGLGDIDTLAARLNAALLAADAQITSRPQACGWAIRP